jgi:hypothetical protein
MEEIFNHLRGEPFRRFLERFVTSFATMNCLFDVYFAIVAVTNILDFANGKT